jgi:hypothetical protein
VLLPQIRFASPCRPDAEAGCRFARRTQRLLSQAETGSHRVTVVEFLEIAQAIDFDPAAALRRVAKASK